MMGILVRMITTASASVFLLSCTSGFYTLPMHSPIYPGDGETITFSLEAEVNAGISRVRLYETVSEVDATGTVVGGTET